MRRARNAEPLIFAAIAGGIVLAQLTLSLSANLLARIEGLMPGTTTRVLGLANRALPNEGGPGTDSVSGETLQRQPHHRLLDLATTLGRDAADRFLQQARSSKD